MAKFKVPDMPKEPPLYRIGPFKGINLSATPTQIDDNQSPDMLNLLLDERGALNKRTGYERVFQTSLGTGNINGMTEYRKADGTSELIFAYDKTLYRLLPDGTLDDIYFDLSGNSVSFFQQKDQLYIQDGQTLFYWDGTMFVDIAENAYIPTLTISRPPSGGGEKYEDWNLIGRGFKDSFSGDGTSTEYQLSLTDLDNTAGTVWAEVDGESKILDTDFTIDYVTGKVTFTTAPSEGTNNVIIKANKTITGFKERIFKCTMHVMFGGGNDTRIFVSGNPDEPNTVWRSGLFDPTYWPENGFYKIGNDYEKVQGFVKQYDYLVVEKERSKWNIGFEMPEGAIEPSFPIRPINDYIGTIAPKSIQVIDNTPVSLFNTGIYKLTASQIRDERNVKHISENVDNRLLAESNLQDAVSVDYDKKYWLAVNGNVYVYDYVINEWYLFDNIHAECFLVYDNALYFGYQGMIYKFKSTSDAFPYNDDGQPIHAYWYSKLNNFEHPERYKLITRIFYTMKSDVHTSANMYIITDKKGETLVDTSRIDQIDFNNFDFTQFAFITSEIPQEIAKKVKEKKITHFQLKLENNTLDQSLGILDVGIKYAFQNEIK